MYMQIYKVRTSCLLMIIISCFVVKASFTFMRRNVTTIDFIIFFLFVYMYNNYFHEFIMSTLFNYFWIDKL